MGDGSERMKIIVHLGYPKTATTTLQVRCFNNISGIRYVRFEEENGLDFVEKTIHIPDTLHFESHFPEVYNRLRNVIWESDTPVLFSHEGFLEKARYSGHDIGLSIERFVRALGHFSDSDIDLHFVVTIRNQADILLSYFLEFLNGSRSDFNHFITKSLEWSPGGLPRYPKDKIIPDHKFMEVLFYDRLYDYLTRITPAANVHFLIFELLSLDRDAFVRDLAMALQTDPDGIARSLSQYHERERTKKDGNYYRHHIYTNALIRVGEAAKPLKSLIGLHDTSVMQSAPGKLLSRSLSYLDTAVPRLPWSRSIGYSPQQRAAVEDVYRESNVRMSQHINRDLTAYGYPS